MAFQFLDSLINGPSTSYENTSDNEDESDIDLDESALVDLPEDSDSESDEPRPNNNIETWANNLTSVTDKVNAESVSHNHLLYHKAVADQILLLSSTNRIVRQPDTPSVAGRSNPYSSQHMLQPMPGRKRRCFQCSRDGQKTDRGRTRETTTGCHLCQVHLHKGYCYSKYHESIKV